jgi:hypothetical protein
MKIIENPLRNFPTSTMIFIEGVPEENIAKAIELANQIDFYFDYIGDGTQYMSSCIKNKVLYENILELGCVQIIIPYNGGNVEINPGYYCRSF